MANVVEGVTAARDLLVVGGILTAAYVVYQLVTGPGQDAATAFGEFYDEVEENMPTSETDSEDHPMGPGGQAATEFAIAETSMAPTIAGTIIGEDIEEQSQVGREKPYPNYVPDGFDPSEYGWERISRPNYTDD